MNKQGECNIECLECACGCGTKIPAKDSKGRPRKFAHGHCISKGYIDKKGYKWISIPGTNKKIQEHRLVMEKLLGRKLRANERVHHENEIKHDNAPDNLVLMNVNNHNHLHRPYLEIPIDIIKCACGCGIKFNKFDSRGREKKYISTKHAWKKPHGRGNPNRKKEL